MRDARLVLALCLGAFAFGAGCDDEFKASTETEGAGGASSTTSTGGGATGGSTQAGGQGGTGASGATGGAAPVGPICDANSCSVKTLTGATNPRLIAVTADGLVYADNYRVFLRDNDIFTELTNHGQLSSGFGTLAGATYWVVGNPFICGPQHGVFGLSGGTVSRSDCGSPLPGPQLDVTVLTDHVCSAGSAGDELDQGVINYTVNCWSRAAGVHTRRLEVQGSTTAVGFVSIVKSSTVVHAIGSTSTKFLVGSGDPNSAAPFDSIEVNTNAAPKPGEAEFFEASIWWVDERVPNSPILRRIAEGDLQPAGTVGEDGPATAIALHDGWLYIAKPDGTVEARQGTDVRTLASFGVGVADLAVDGTGIYAVTDGNELRWLEPSSN